MKNKILCLLFTFVGLGSLQAQRYTETQQLVLPDTVTAFQAEWVDLDNDGLLDIAVFAGSPSGQFLYTFRNDTINGFFFMTVQATGFGGAVYKLYDFNRDNKMDILASGMRSGIPSTSALLNQGGFQFQETPIVEAGGSAICMADFNNDGRKELILSGENSEGLFLNFYQEQGGVWEIVNDSLKVKGTDILSYDFNSDMYSDLAISGVDSNGLAYQAVLYMDGSFKIRKLYKFADPVNGNFAIADLLDDGLFDLHISGTNDSGNYATYKILNLKDKFSVSPITLQLDTPRIFIADIDIDGVVDFSLWGYDAKDTINRIQQSSALSDLLPHAGLQDQRFGDLEKDGDLDLLQIVAGGFGNQFLRILKNTTPIVNKPPRKSLFSFSSSIFDRQFMYWDKSTDDHTDSLSLTYDLAIWDGAGQLLSGEFDLENNKRLTTSHGNTGSNNFTLLRLPLQAMEYSIQSIDNSFHAGEFTCTGKLNAIESCAIQVGYSNLNLCKDEEIELKGNHEVYWFSFADGFLGKSKELTFTSNKSDTLFYFDRDSLCGFIQVYTVKVPEMLVRESFTTEVVCTHEVVKFSVEMDWDSVAWSSSALGFLSNANTIELSAVQHDTVTVFLSNGPNCIDIRKTELVLSLPVINVNGEVFQIMKGSGVQLEATGGETYSWTPSSGLSSATISNPMATPVTTTEYVVVTTDSIGCTASRKVLVKVEQTAFIPSLFTPNNDGSNDQLKVYGMLAASGFRLKIYNREGNLVYETTDPASAGWDGTNNGVEQPSGVYYWKVEGIYTSGSKLLLNGKSSGSVVLMR